MSCSIIVLGGGSAGLITAVTLKRLIPQLTVRVIRSEKIGIIGVGEGTVVTFREHFFRVLGLDPRSFYAIAEPSWKLGIKFLWGKRDAFYFPFTQELAAQYKPLPRPASFYYEHTPRWVGVGTACMAHDIAFPCMKGGQDPDLRLAHAYHIENHKLVEWLNLIAKDVGVQFIEATMQSVEQDDDGIQALIMEDGSRHEADVFVDASGFRAELIEKVLHEPRIDYSESLFCDRAWVAGWQRAEEPILPYTTAETMDAGWCWQIEHETWINRGYVFSSGFISDEDALQEFLRKNPRIENEPRLVKFRSGRAERAWVKNVVAVGNASGFVEPLEATALHVITRQTLGIATVLANNPKELTPSMVRMFNRVNSALWDETRDFLATHYAFNDRLDTPFWRHCMEKTDIGDAEEIVSFYRENGPSPTGARCFNSEQNFFGTDGYYHMLLGMDVPYKRSSLFTSPPSEQEIAQWRNVHAGFGRLAQAGCTVSTALPSVRQDGWDWSTYRDMGAATWDLRV